ncbi:MAG TPA: hypothetical protein VMC43_02275 [Candidatus Paceibacterota bacterium]|nr:hypothetical protein [Candidatus Paceibacterota bacterium]
MAHFAREHQELVLIGCAIVFVGLLGTCYVWGVGAMIESLNASLVSSKANDSSVQVDVAGAQSILKERGLIE